MAGPEILEVRLSRLCTMSIGAIALVFTLAGLDLAVFRTILDFQISPENKWPFYGFLFSSLFLGGIILVQMILYFLQPPLLLRVDPVGITFGTGFRYHPFLIPGKWVKGVRRGITADMGAVTWFDLVCIDFDNSPDIPGSMGTSMGIGYYCYILTISWFYRDTSSFRIIETVDQYLKAGIWGTRPGAPNPFFHAVSGTPPVTGRLP